MCTGVHLKNLKTGFAVYVLYVKYYKLFKKYITKIINQDSFENY